MAAPIVYDLHQAVNRKMLQIIAVVCFLSAFIAEHNCARLSDPKILLPYHSSVVTNFTLHINLTSEEESHAYDNCYTWRSTQQEVATIQLVNSTDGECAFAAVVSAVSKTPHRKTSIVIVENKVTKELLKCIVIVEDIAGIEIQTTTRLLYLEDSPEELTIRGLDKEGNVFSSLAGLRFEWSLEADTSMGDDVVDANNILRILRFSESHYSTPSYIEQLESSGLQGDMILVEGIRTGSANVKAILRDPAYKNVAPYVVRIVVIANLMVSPPESYVLVYSEVKYTVELIKQNAIIAIKMPSEQFYLQIEDPKICEIDVPTSVATALELGSTEVFLMDRNIKGQDALRRPSAMLYVVTASRLAYVIMPHRKWVLETGRFYEIEIEIYDKNNHKVYPSDNIVIDAFFPEEYFNVLRSTPNGTWHYVQTLKKGFPKLHSVLVAITKKDGSKHLIKPEIKQSQPVEIYDPIRVSPSQLFFPWDPEVPLSHQYQLKAEGGSGEYLWKTSVPPVSSVNFNGEISTGDKGTTNITASDMRNPAHWASTQVHILPPHAMKFHPHRVEAAVGTLLQLPLSVTSLHSGQETEFSDCRKMRLNVTFSDANIFQYDYAFSELPDNGCRMVTIKALVQGYTEVKATYSVRGVDLETVVMVAAYDPLQPVDPEKQTVIAVGAQKTLLFRGGPQPWVIDSSKYFRDLVPEKQQLVKVESDLQESKNRGLHAFHVSCRDFGEQDISLTVGNKKTAKNKFPATETVSIRFICAEPVELHLHPVVKMSHIDLPPCPVHQEQAQVPVHCNRDLDVVVTVTDLAGRKFDNISSLEFDWQLSDKGLGSLAVYSGVLSDPVSKRSKQVLLPAGEPGFVTITATVSQYNYNHLRQVDSAISSYLSNPLSKSLDLRLVDEAVVNPDVISIFNHPSNMVNVAIEKGSGFFLVRPGRDGLIDIKYSDQDKSMQIRPILDGALSVVVYDLCIDSPDPPQVSVYVSGIGSVQLTLTSKVEVGNDVQARVQVWDTHSKPLLASFFPLMSLRLVPASNIITVKPSPDSPSDQFTAFYTVHGAQVGHTSLEAVVSPQAGVTVSSQIRPIEVFPPLKLIPQNITLIIGAKFQVLSRGGPSPQCTVVYSIRNKQVAEVSSSGLLDAQDLGSTIVVGQAIGQDTETGETIVYSQDEARVHVVQLTEIRIHAPLTRLQTGTKMPMYAVGLTEQETPFTFGSAVPGLTFTWSVNNKEIVHLQNVFSESDVKPSEYNDFHSQLVALESGQVTIRLHVRSSGQKPQIRNNAELVDELQIQVFEKLALVVPLVCDGKILMTPNTEALIKTNRDRAANLEYKLLPPTGKTDLVSIADGRILVSGQSTGETTLHITSQEEFGSNQTLVVLIQVKPVSYAMINADSKFTTSGGVLKKIPVGSTLYFSVSYHDNVGQKFYATNVQMQYRCSRYDLVQVSRGQENDTLVMKVSHVGDTILKVWDRHNHWVADVIHIPVDYAVSPASSALSVGDIVCFRSPLVTAKGHKGTWTADPYLDISKEAGIAMAMRVGKATIRYNVSGDVSSYTEVSVSPVTTLTLSSNVKHLTNVPYKGWKPFVGVAINGRSSVRGEDCVSQIANENYEFANFPIFCSLDLITDQQTDLDAEHLFSAQPHYDYRSGQVGCLIQQVPSYTSLQHLSSLRASVGLTVTVPRGEDQLEVSAQATPFVFMPAFHIVNPEVHLSTVNPQAYIRVTTTTTVVDCIKVKVSDDNFLEAQSGQQDSQSESVTQFPIKLIESLALWEKEQLDMHIEVSCAMTGQKVKLPVYISLIGQKPEFVGKYAGWQTFLRNLFYNYQSWLLILLIIIVTAVIVIIGYHFLIVSRQKPTPAPVYGSPVSPQPMQFSPSGMGSPPPYGAYSPPTYKTPYLWSPGYSPVDVSPRRRRQSPLAQRTT